MLQKSSPEPGKKHPITFHILQKIWPIVQTMKDSLCIKAALAFFRGLHGSEYLKTKFMAGPKLSQLTICSKSRITYTVMRSKTQPKGFTLPYHCSCDTVCPVCCTLEYLSHRRSTDRPRQSACLFIENGVELTKDRFNYIIKQAMATAGYNHNHFTTHSLRSGVTTTAACNNFSDWELKKTRGMGN